MSNVQGMEKFAECIEQAGLVDSPSKAGWGLLFRKGKIGFLLIVNV